MSDAPTPLERAESNEFSRSTEPIYRKLADFQQILIAGRDSEASSGQVHLEQYAAAMIWVMSSVIEIQEEIASRLLPVVRGHPSTAMMLPPGASDQTVKYMLRTTLGRDGTTPESLIEQFELRDFTFEPDPHGRTIDICRIAATYCAQAEERWLAGQLLLVVERSQQAMRWIGFLNGFDLGRAEQSKAATQAVIQRLQEARHRENRANCAEAMKFYDENRSKFSSDTDIATYIADKIVPAKFMTVRNWITEHKRKKAAS